ncbi:MAG: SAM-dependent methyltransferase [Cellvibrionaceae bacterium]|nr:SAM-dependent methyltransferase [Cellvibrionaceae bacterium]
MNCNSFIQLSQLLLDHRHYWQPRAYMQAQLPWQAQLPELNARLLSLDKQALERLENNPDVLLQLLQEALPKLSPLSELLQIPPCEPQPLIELDPFFQRHIPGRKWQQIQAFAAALPRRGQQLLDWCSGKGHLARYLYRQQPCPACCLERDPALVAAGRELSEGMELAFAEVDVLQQDCRPWVQTESQLLALHACGDLHRQLLQLCADTRPRALALAPCCYQKTAQAQYRPLSQLGRQYDLALQRLDLHTAVQETVTAPAAVRHKREQIQAWRLGFDCWQRSWRGVDEYLTTPSLPQSALKLGFEAFCRKLAAAQGLAVPVEVDWAYWQQRGAERFAQARRLDLLRLGFRRALELWIVQDLALYLHQQGYQVQLGVFCQRELSPRNLLINAYLPEGDCSESK